MFDHYVGAVVRCHRGQHTGAQRDQVWQGLGANGGQDIAAQSRFELDEVPLRGDLQVNGIPGQPQVQPGRNPGRQIAAIRGGGAAIRGGGAGAMRAAGGGGGLATCTAAGGGARRSSGCD